ncbi:adenylate/guanylate cyclase domain-containing protein [Mycolicibacterium brumae]|uniref:Adenylate/guanylate cyclase domain-containing protein n=1 Tax=Mycolicibacterium brumae TaxID=85968 RepID=A0A2G5PA29_9MYCO|nr:adenylate/guanylate cyclase domain-containing protein [Mycolicibacterium brumae]MCV7193330.1 adenylate/guanylate cyclase domain-containing protein [Mycolicibacterium brumae]PIB74744.1 adenylate/guanylate cyclase domain-containing protein [Mycolicibacterium brumae]RWA17754.1 adenylyl cyclase [Mycolicibacterium brumae DSM 44177]UWW07302.1 adenylate/guanylate cyclase domain-containing protein [Mycolicibacterium brumae]
MRWVVRTPWPVFTLSMLQADIIGALFVLGFLRFGLPPEDRLLLQDLPATNLWFFLAYLLVAFTVGAALSLWLLAPVFRWQRRDALLVDPDPEGTELARSRALRMPIYRTAIAAVNWLIGGVVFISVTWPVDSSMAPVLAVATALGATATSIIGYLQSERVLRPVAVAALRGGSPNAFHAPGVLQRLLLTWILSTGVPVLTILMAIVASKTHILDATAEQLFVPILLLTVTALIVGLTGTILVAMSIADPLRQLRWALGEVQRGNYNAHMQIYDASELGMLQAGFNDMVRDLAERQRLRDLFGRYVGEDVARRALERGTELGGQERYVAVLFVDLVGSTHLAATRPPGEVVTLLNEFFRVVVDTVDVHGGFVNKFQGDAALCIFGAPIEHPDASGAALASARELHDNLLPLLGDEFGIGVSAGRAIAGHIGAQARFEYTVIGDPVNEAARLTELAKVEPGRVLASSTAVSDADGTEALAWDVGEIVQLRGRTEATQLARPRVLASSDEVEREDISQLTDEVSEGLK